MTTTTLRRTTDIGGYSGGNPSDPTFRELIVRWFQYGATCPLFRQHGARNTEPWGYGNESFAAIVKVINWRESIKPYILQQMEVVAKTGMPVNRPLWVSTLPTSSPVIVCRCGVRWLVSVCR